MGADASRPQPHHPPLSSSWSHHHSSRFHRRHEDDIPEEELDLPQSASVDLILAQKEEGVEVGVILDPDRAMNVSKAASKMSAVHFADFSLFPDRFSSRHRAEKGRGGVEGGADAPRGMPIPSIKVSKSSEPVTGSYQGSSISKYNVRLR